MKPRLKRAPMYPWVRPYDRVFVWTCTGGGEFARGLTPQQAFRGWEMQLEAQGKQSLFARLVRAFP